MSQEVAAWIAKHGTMATPHSQRSVARIKVAVSPYEQWNLVPLIEDAECALSTPSQGPVKRADEQEFALRNGQNLMFVEDAVRLLLSTFAQKHPAGSIEVTHLESLHPHDAFAAASWGAAV
ncbi:GTP cyclohydrolase, FolE2/MptA family [Stenotrophomonas sp. SORGH_AS_0282]|jgi:GTP cyclohydrolase I|uniref:GTP cyclohydrolase, FolE2/MptA family n=1 Tax=Stenotrophomonas TaxID=40323 RepID=UPI00278773A8|nr:GTP cyclohydrolase, FolE2/MptA family [Stenotrophomonas sp. SORGH_AS_0282]MDQ1062673.1 GTP cyclohydrolase FolE2 [Stenotrophomonas sp. SORGH_AS_0282]MDQ1188972.1 GTP cyclohydrolase FolE2 [Stenotrophomonas sp. SORGH_AS_0282]